MKRNIGTTVTLACLTFEISPVEVGSSLPVPGQPATHTSTPPFEDVRAILVDRPLFRPKRRRRTK